MPSWSEVEAQAPELAARAREVFDAHTHKTLATLRRDGSPRISGTEVEFEQGEMWLGSIGDPPDHIVVESWHVGRRVTRRTRT